MNTVLRRKIVQERTGFGVSTLNYMVRTGQFPRPVKLGKRAVGWIEEEVEAHIKKLVADRDDKN